MVEIFREFDDALLKKLGAHGMDMAYVARANGVVLGYCVYRLRGDAVELVSLWANGDAALADGIARAALASCKEVSVYAVCVGDGDELKNFCRCISLPSEGQLEIDSILRSCAGAPSGM